MLASPKGGELEPGGEEGSVAGGRVTKSIWKNNPERIHLGNVGQLAGWKPKTGGGGLCGGAGLVSFSPVPHVLYFFALIFGSPADLCGKHPDRRQPLL